MKTVFSPRHRGHANQLELMAGAIVPGFELPSRAEFIHDRILEVGLGDILAPKEFDLSIAERVQAKDFLAFLPTVYPRWKELGREGTALAYTWPTRGLRGDVVPECLDGALGHYSFDAGCGFVEGTWDAIKSSHDVVLTAAELVKEGAGSAYALCRPPGHHAGSNFMGGYCYINNAAVAAEYFRVNGAKRVAILDVDYHHGNGTQEIFYSRADVQVINIHGDPNQEYPYFLGYKEETGACEGEGFNINYPLRWGSDWAGWSQALKNGIQKLEAFGPDVVIVSLGVDTFEKDPISQFKLKTEDYPKIGALIKAIGKPTLFVQEGGYAVADIGVNAVGVLTGFEGA